MLRERRKENEKKVKKSTYIMHACTLHIHDVERLLSQFDTQSPQYRTEFLMLHPILINSLFLWVGIENHLDQSQIWLL